ncbi:MAG: porin [Bacteroidia bacterium]|nr:porin [Bacteroidia bacterium]
MKRILTIIIVLNSMMANAQKDTTINPLSFSGYLETYYLYDFGNPADHNRPGFVYSHNRHNEVNINLGYIKAAYEKDNVRANLALMSGTYSNANLAAEPGVLKNIYEGNIGVKVSKKSNLWIDAGIFSSHIGFESAVSKDCWTLTRSILADNSPYYESGVKLSYTSPNEKWFISGLFLNGWQRIQRVDYNNTPAFGTQFTFKPNKKITLNSSSFVGNDKPDSTKQMRYFHNLYGIVKLNDKLAFTAGFDFGAEQNSKGSSDYNTWYSPVLILRLSPNSKNSFAARIEYYEDINGVIINTGTPNGFKTMGYSLNYDHAISDNAMWRIEGKSYTSKDEIFLKDDAPTNSNFSITTSLAVSF